MGADKYVPYDTFLFVPYDTTVIYRLSKNASIKMNK